MRENIPLLELNKVGKRFRTNSGAVDAIRECSLKLYSSQSISIVGPSGSGKSTLLNIMGTLAKPSYGTTLYMGRSISDLSGKDLSSLRNQFIGFVFQHHCLFPSLTTLQNVSLPLLYSGLSRSERKQRAYNSLESVGLADLSDRRPKQLSSGQSQRVAIARAIVNEPRLVLADEPTASLDAKNTENITDILIRLSERGTCVVIASHDHKVFERTANKIVINDGSVSCVCP